MADIEQVIPIEQTPANPDVLQKYHEAARITNDAIGKVIGACKDGALIVDVCRLGDDFILEETKKIYKGKIAKGIAFPTSISPNHIICHFSPLRIDPEAEVVFKNGDVVKIELGTQIDGYMAMVATTIVVGADEQNPVTGRIADLLQAGHLASEVAARVVNPGNWNMQVTDVIQELTREFNILPVEGMLSHQQARNVTDGKKRIILNPNEQQLQQFESVKFDENEVYSVDILVTTGDGKPRQSSYRPTIYKRTNYNYQLRLKTSRQLYTEAVRKYGEFPFPIHGLIEEKRGRIGINECLKHNLVIPYEIYEEGEGEFVAQFLFTVLLTSSGPLRITVPPFSQEVIKSDKAIQNQRILDLLDVKLPVAKKKKKPKVKSKDNQQNGIKGEDDAGEANE